ncbi:MAG: sensor histidine kinase [Planctomycetota bacterium]
MSLIARFAVAGCVVLVAAIAVALLVWQPASRDAFVDRTDSLLRNTEEDFSGLATSLVDETMAFAADSSRAADAQRALATQDLPLVLYTDADGRIDEDRLREALRAAVADPESSGAGKLAAVRAEMLQRTRSDVERRLERLRGEQGAVAVRHGEAVAWQTVAAWTGLLLVLVAGFGLLLDRFALSPLRAATKAVERFGAGERGVRVDPSGARELTTLARVFNETAGAVETAENENERLRAGLEEKVKERTAALVRAARASTAGTMAGGVAHEFNNLLGGILGCATEALDEDLSDDAKSLLEMIRKTATRGVGMTQAMLRATRAEPELSVCDPAALFDEVLAEVRPPPGIAVEREIADVTLRADAVMLRQVLANLVRNAVHAMGEEGTLHLGVGEADDSVQFTVADSGPGIDPAIREILFEPFVTTRRGGREGAGLGLFLAERLISAHGGSIGVESETGRGTRFTITLARDS